MMRRVFLLVISLFTMLSVLVAGAPSAQAVKPVKPPRPSPTLPRYVALGDSFASGAGLTPYSNTACYRSATQAYPTLLAGTAWTLSFVACSGATTDTLLATQVPAAPDTAAKVVTVTIGGNDIGFSKILSDCVIIGSGAGGCSDTIKADTAAALGALPAKLGSTLDQLRLMFPNARIHVTGYPEMFGSFTGQCKVGSTLLGGLYIAEADGRWLNGVAADLNAKIAASTTGRTNVVFDDVAARFDTHGRCDTSTVWVNGVIMKSWLSTEASERSFHPTADGQKLGYAASINLAG